MTVLLITADTGVERVTRRAAAVLDGVVTVVSDVRRADGALRPDAVICDHADFDAARDRWPDSAVIVYADSANSERAIGAITRGALDYLVRPIDETQLAGMLREAARVSRDRRVPAVYESRDEAAEVDRIIGQSPPMKEVYRLIGLFAPRDINVLITGESGTGKELVARAILHHSPRVGKPFLAVNCAAIPETLLESELFGHEKGAFTGADQRRIGKFEQCHEGTLFLDEIGDIPLATQAKLLRVLQDRSFQRLGGTSTVHCDVRIIAATHQPLARLIEEGQFRQDLFYRINVATIGVPPLREREVDPVLLAHHFVERYNQELGTAVASLAPETLPVLLQYPWPGNVRELENALKSAMVVARGAILRPEFLPAPIRDWKAAPGAVQETPVASVEAAGVDDDALAALARGLVGDESLAGQVHAAAVARLERELIVAALTACQGRTAPAARLLGMSRTTLRSRIERLQIRIAAGVDQ